MIGILRPLLQEPWPLLLVTPSGRHLHAGCMSESLLLKCADVELVYVRLSDVGRDLFSRVADELMRRRETVTVTPPAKRSVTGT